MRHDKRYANVLAMSFAVIFYVLAASLLIGLLIGAMIYYAQKDPVR